MLIQKKQHNGYIISFVLCFATALFIFLPFLVVDSGFFLYCGDFNSQQIPFYSYCQNFIKSGGGTFSFETDLGSGFLSSYSFYLLGSPTFWLTTLFPAKAVPYLLVPLLCLKFAVAGVGVFAFAKRYIKDRNLTLLAAVLYTFSGFSVYNVFFNHFIEPIMLFPFLLWAMDAFFYDKKRGPFGIMVALSLLNNFFFFIGNVVFCIIYFIIKLVCKDYVIKFKDFLLFVFEGVLGVLAAMCLVLPTALTLLNNPRIANWAEGFGLVMYSQPQQYFAILSSLFLPPDPPYMPNIFTECNVKWTSLSAYLPLFSFAGVLCYLKQNKKTFFSRILCVCFVMALVPILNSAFYGFNSSYYARWFYMPILIMSVCTVLSVRDANKNDVFKAIKITAVITAVFFIFGVLPKKTTDEATQVEKLVIGVTQEPAKLVLTVLTALLGLLAVYMILRFAKSKPRAVRALIACTMGFSVCFAIIHISLGKFPQWENDADYKQSVYDEKKALQEALPTDEFYRIDAYGTHENMGLHLNRPCIQFFNSTVSPSIMEFYPFVGEKRDVSSAPEHDNYALRGLLSVKYILVKQTSTNEYFEKVGTQDGYKAVKDVGSYTIVENENYLPMGFTYDYYLTESDFEDIPKSTRSNILMHTIMLSDEQSSKYGHLLQKLPEGKTHGFSYEQYLIDVADRKASSAREFKTYRNGFTAKINLPKKNLVFFSIPYDKGFTATVNGKKVPVEKVSAGMMAVECDKGDNDIRFVYTPMGVKLGNILSIIGVCGLVVYILISQNYKRILKQKAKKQNAES